MSFTSRNVVKKVLSREQAEGEGARVYRSIGGYELHNFDPFLLLDEVRIASPAGFPDHPHRGFETVTYVLPTSKGKMSHEDFCGHKGIIGPGELQWMTAGRGILHSEVPADQEISHGLQLWVNLPASLKMCDPAYQELTVDQVPVVTKDSITVRVIAGEAFGVESKVYTRTPTHYLHFEMKPHSVLHQPIQKNWNAFIYVLTGEAFFGENAEPIDLHHTVVLSQDGDGITVTTKDHEVGFVLIAGQPLNEPVVQRGPFVMNTQKEILQTFQDFMNGENGFERARNWQSEYVKARSK